MLSELLRAGKQLLKELYSAVRLNVTVSDDALRVKNLSHEPSMLAESISIVHGNDSIPTNSDFTSAKKYTC